ncbi:hypothetical protein GCM10010207_51530 [Streptomyces atratus]|nr:hypothetical protein GCM10010207_51530 [Streptomyces atratus]
MARRCQAAHIQKLAAGIKTVRHRLSLPIDERGTKPAASGYRSKNEWFRKSRRFATLENRHAAAVSDRQAGRVRVVQGGNGTRRRETQRIQNRSGHTQNAAVGPRLTHAHWSGTVLSVIGRP